jgi:lysozyme
MESRLSLSANGLACLKAYEALRLSFYRDDAGILTIYYGHVVRPGEQFDHSVEQAELVLAQDLDAPEACVNAWCNVALTQGQFDALVLFAFNVGCDALLHSTLLACVKAGDFDAAADEFPRWDKVHKNGRVVESAGLRKRRAAERCVFLDQPWSAP